MSYEQSLNQIIHSVHRLATIVENITYETLRLFKYNDIQTRAEVWRIINELTNVVEEVRKDIVHNILVHIVKVQPLGRELMTLYVLISATYDLYRISRYCREISYVDKILSPNPGLAKTELEHLFEKAHEAVKYAIKDLLELKPLNKEKVGSVDSLIDTVYANMLRKIIEWDEIPSSKALELLIIRHIERIIDHTQYIEQYLAEL